MTVRIRLFAAARDAFGFESRDVDIEEASLNGVRKALLTQRPGAEKLLNACRFAVNMEYTGAAKSLNAGDEVAVIPPVSGG